ncbi:MAG: hypothetical protein Q8P40_06905 [Nitrospirota bacterium]|nr:hypothetical protein [Nitrospirota bacterium]
MSQEDVLRIINENHGIPQKELPERPGISWNVSALVRALGKKGLIRRAWDG